MSDAATKKLAIFFQRKKRNTGMIFRMGKKNGVSKQKWHDEIKKKLVIAKKIERKVIFFF